jgi:hypothetical protein
MLRENSLRVGGLSAAHAAASHPSADLEVVFSDLRSENRTDKAASGVLSLADWQRQAFDAAIDYIFLLNREIIDIWQRNSNASFSLLRKLTEAKSPGDIVEFQAAHLSNQIAALAGQREELTALSLKAATTFLRRTYPAA